MLANDIKEVVKRRLSETFAAEEAAIIYEMPIQAYGQAYADVAILDGDSWCGYEIKSASDSLSRLPRQVVSYGRVFDRCMLLAAPQHIERAAKMLPPFWGIAKILAPDGLIQVVRPAAENGGCDPGVIASLVRKHEWRQWALDAGRIELLRGGRDGIAAVMRRELSRDELRAIVGRIICARGGGSGHGL